MATKKKQDFVVGKQVGMVLKRTLTQEGDVTKVEPAATPDIINLPTSEKIRLGTRIKSQTK